MMIGQCANCGHQTSRYGTPEEMSKPCAKCNGIEFWCAIFKYPGGIYYNLVNLKTNELLDTQDEIPEK